MRRALGLVVVDEQGVRGPRLAMLALGVSLASTACSLLSQVVVAALVGAQPAYDAYVVATSVPIGLSAIVQFAATFGLVPRLAGARGPVARRLCSVAFWMVLTASLAVTCVMWATAPSMTGLLAPGFAPATAEQAAQMLRIACVGMALDLSKTVLVSAHIATGRAILTQILGAGWYVVWPLTVWTCYPGHGALTLAAAYTAAHLVVFALFVVSSVRHRLVEVLPARDFRQVSEVLRLAVPAAAALLATQAVPFVDRAVASFLRGPAISYVTYATRPSDVFVRGVPLAFGMVFFPILARHAGARDWPRLRQATGSLLRLTLLAAALAAVSLTVLRAPVVAMLFVRGAFGPGAAWTVADLLRWYAAAIVPLSALSVLTYLLCSLGQWWNLVLLGTLSAAAAAGVDVALSRLLAVEGLAVSALCVASLTALGAAIVAGRAVPGLLDGVSGGWLLRVGVAAAVTLALGTALERVLPVPHGLGQTFTATALTGAGLAGTYVVALTALRVPQTDPLLAAATRLLGNHS